MIRKFPPKLTFAIAASLIAVSIIIWNVFLQSAPGEPVDSPPPDSESERVELTAVQIENIGLKMEVLSKQQTSLFITRPAEVTVDINRSSEVTAGVAGVVRRMHVVQGSDVSIGTPLATLRSADMATLQGDLLNARDQAELAAISFERERRLRDQQITSEEEFLTARRLLSEARIAERRADQALQAIGVDAAKTANVPIGEYVLRSPIAGTVISQSAVQGQLAAADVPLFQIADLSHVWVQAQLYPPDIGRIAIGDTAAVDVGERRETLNGVVSQVRPSLDEATRTALAIISVENPPGDSSAGALTPGQFVTARIPLTERRHAVIVPETALVQNGRGDWQIFIETERNTFEPVNVDISERILTGVVLTDAPVGANAVIQGAFFLRAELDKGSILDND